MNNYIPNYSASLISGIIAAISVTPMDFIKTQVQYRINTNITQIIKEIINTRVVNNYLDSNTDLLSIDIYIPNLNKMIEVKSTRTYQLNLEDTIFPKANACIKQGFYYEIWVYSDKNGKKKEIITEFN